MPRCLKCARVVERANALCTPCEREQAVASQSAALDVNVPGEPMSPEPDLAAVHIPSPASAWSTRHIAAALAAAGAAAAVTFAVLGIGGAGGPSVNEASMVRMPHASASPAAAQAVDKWTDANSARWVSNHRRSIAFELQAENIASAGLARVRPILVVRCLGNTTEAFVYTQWPAALEPQDDRRTAHISFDDEVAVSERWFTSADHDALFAPDGETFARRLARAQTMRFGFTPHNGRPETLEFHVSGFGEHARSLARLCRWK
jgi:hypothetical protein